MSAFGDAVVGQIAALPVREWSDAIRALAEAKKVTAVAVDARNPNGFPTSLLRIHADRLEHFIPAGLLATADPALLGRALGNLVRNASMHDGPQAKVAIHATETADAVAITVTDDGPGVPPAELPHIFEPFYRLDRSRSRDTGGSGLGLAIVRNASQTCGGKTVAMLPENGGFPVTIRLPKMVPEAT